MMTLFPNLGLAIELPEAALPKSDAPIMSRYEDLCVSGRAGKMVALSVTMYPPPLF